MPIEHIILNLNGYKIIKIKEGSPYELEVKYVDIVFCPHCKSEDIRKKDKFIREIRHADICCKKVILKLQSYKYQCKSCNRYFNQRFPGILPYKRHTEIFRREVFTQHKEGISQKTLSDRLNVGTATIERWYKDFIKLKVSMMSDYECPRVLGIDEHFFTKKKGYATTFCDLSKHRIYDVVLGRSEKSLTSYLKKLKGKDKVKVVVIDLSETYRNIVRKYFPNAKIVTDRFHVIRLINQHFLNIWKELDPIGRNNRGLLSLMRRKPENLKPEQKINLHKYLNQYPALERIYFMKQKLHRLLSKKRKTAKECKKLIPKFIKIVDDLLNSQMYGLVKMGKTLDSWSEEVVRMWRFSKSNGITEGFHTKMEMISRRAYGFKNFENYRLRIKALCC